MRRKKWVKGDNILIFISQLKTIIIVKSLVVQLVDMS